MRRLTKVLLLLTLVTLPLGLVFLFGVINVENIPELYVVFPVGASLFGLFLICRLMEKEVAAFDAEQCVHPAPSPADSPRYVGDHEHSSPIESRIGHVERAKCLAGWFWYDHAVHQAAQDCTQEIKPACLAVAFGEGGRAVSEDKITEAKYFRQDPFFLLTQTGFIGVRHRLVTHVKHPSCSLPLRRHGHRDEK